MNLEFEYYKNETGVVITGCNQKTDRICIPNQLEEYTVVGIEKKAFLGNQLLTSVIVPDNIRTIGDWAFAYCKNLEQVQLPNKEITFGKEICIGCENLQQFGPPQSSWKELLPVLMKLKLAEKLCNPKEYGTDTWCEQIDIRIHEYLCLPDDAQYQGLWTFGEEDYTDRSFEKEIYEEERRKDKAELALCRLYNQENLKAEQRELLEAYLLEHARDEESMETLLVLKERCISDIAYFKAFLRLPGIQGKEINTLLKLLPEASAEIRSFLVNSSKQLLQKKDFFDTLLS